jgi:hypothetical protein
VLNFTVALTTLALALVLLPGLWREAGRAPGGGEGETLVAGEVISPPAPAAEGAPPSTRELTASPGESFEVELDCEPGEGCHWELSGPLDPGVVSLAGREVREEPGSPSGRVESWRFEAAGPGEAVISLACLQPGSPYPLMTETLHLVVTGP